MAADSSQPEHVPDQPKPKEKAKDADVEAHGGVFWHMNIFILML